MTKTENLDLSVYNQTDRQALISEYITNMGDNMVKIDSAVGSVKTEVQNIDYNKIGNQPIKNITGTENAPIIFNNLSSGMYIVNGNYKVTDNDTTKSDLLNVRITVQEDVSTNNKIITYLYVSDGEQWEKIITIIGDDNYSESDFMLSGSSSMSITIEEDV